MDARGPALIRLGAYLSGIEAQGVADCLEVGDSLDSALYAVPSSRRDEARRLIDEAGYGDADDAQLTATIAGLRVLQGAHEFPATATPVWTAPHNLARFGGLNAMRDQLINSAVSSVVCSTYNFQRSSQLWDALRHASERPDVSVTIYIDADANSGQSFGTTTSLTAEDIAHALPHAKVFRTADDSGDEHGDANKTVRHYRNHAKFISVDHQVLLVTSANFSYSAEERNIELGLRIEDEALAEAVEQQMRLFEPHLYQLVDPMLP